MNIVVIFTYGISLKKWSDIGVIDREVKVYKELIRKGVKVNFITFGDETDYEYKHIIGDIAIYPVFERIGYSKSRMIRFIKSFFISFVFSDLFKQVDVIKTNQMWGAWVAVMSSILWSKKLIIRCGYEAYKNAVSENSHSALYLLFLKSISYISYHASDKVLVSSKVISDYIVDEFDVEKEKVKYMWNYVDTGKFYKIGSEKYDRRAVFIGRLSREKNIFALIDALDGEGIDLDIVGDGELREEIVKYSELKDLNVNMLGIIPHDHLPYVLNKYSLYVLCSFYEGNPKALLEAMACGLAVVGVNVAGISEVIEDKQNGILCDNNYISIRSAILSVIEDKDFRDSLGYNANKTIIENCSLDKYVKGEIDLLYNIMNEN